MNVSEVISILQELAPSHYAMSWDNSGFLIGRSDSKIRKIGVALDATNEVIDKAIEDGIDLLVTHHPIIFSSIKQVNDETFLGRKILSLIEHHISVYAMHTNYDIAGGMPELAAQRMQLITKEPLEITDETDGEMKGIGKIGTLGQTVTLGECANLVKQRFGLEHVLVFGDEEKEIKCIAISPGSGRSMIKEAVKKGADVIITGDIGHHEGLDALDMGISVIEAGHYGLEYIFIDHVASYLKGHADGVDVYKYPSGVPYKVK